MSRTEEVIAAERDTVAWYLRRWAKEERKHAAALLADTMQSKPDADRCEVRALVLDEAAERIVAGRHWK